MLLRYACRKWIDLTAPKRRKAASHSRKLPSPDSVKQTP
nr:MAG TPA: hypothetical protein [Caudoviricetes sp.]